MAPKFPRPIYLAPLLLLAGRVAAWLLEQRITTDPAFGAWVQALPLDLITGVALAFLAGLLWHDLVEDRNSWLRSWWSYLTGGFEVTASGSGYNDDPARIQYWAIIRFRRDIKSAQLRLRIYAVTGMKQSPLRHIVLVEQLRNVMRGEVRRVEIVDIAAPTPGGPPPITSGWGPRREGRPHLIPGVNNVVDLELAGTLIPQRHRFNISWPLYGEGHHRPALFGFDAGSNPFKT